MIGTLRGTIQLVSIILALSAVPQIASATSIFKIQFDFTSAGAGVGSGYLHFAVDPDNLPFDTWIDLRNENILASNIELIEGSHDAYFPEFHTQNTILADIYITNNNPDFTVELRQRFPTVDVILNLHDDHADLETQTTWGDLFNL